MSWFRSSPPKEPERFYLLPGQGGTSFRRKQRVMLTWSVIVGLLLSACLVALMLYLNKDHR